MFLLRTYHHSESRYGSSLHSLCPSPSWARVTTDDGSADENRAPRTAFSRRVCVCVRVRRGARERERGVEGGARLRVRVRGGTLGVHHRVMTIRDRLEDCVASVMVSGGDGGETRRD